MKLCCKNELKLFVEQRYAEIEIMKQWLENKSRSVKIEIYIQKALGVKAEWPCKYRLKMNIIKPLKYFIRPKTPQNNQKN